MSRGARGSRVPCLGRLGRRKGDEASAVLSHSFQALSRSFSQLFSVRRLRSPSYARLTPIPCRSFSLSLSFSCICLSYRFATPSPAPVFQCSIVSPISHYLCDTLLQSTPTSSSSYDSNPPSAKTTQSFSATSVRPSLRSPAHVAISFSLPYLPLTSLIQRRNPLPIVTPSSS